MKSRKRVLVFAKQKPGLADALTFLREKFTDVISFVDALGNPFPEAARGRKADICISYISPWIIPSEVLSETVEFNLNFHPGPPEYPGIGCTNFAIYDGAKEFGITVHHMEPKVDTGAIVHVRRFPVIDGETVYSLTQKCYKEILTSFKEVFDYYIGNGMLPKSDEIWQRQPYTRKELNELCRLSIDMGREEMLRRIRATSYPDMPGAYIDIQGVRFIPGPQDNQYGN